MPAIRKCTNCGHRGGDVDVVGMEQLCHFCRADASSPTSSRHMHALLKALGKHAPSSARVDEDGVAVKGKVKPRAYTPTPADLGLSDGRAVWRALVAGELNGADDAEGFDKAMKALAIVRAACFKHQRAQYVADDCPHVRAGLAAGHTIADMARGIAAASKDRFHARTQTIVFRDLVAKLPALLAQPAAAALSPAEARQRLAEEFAAALADLKRLAPFEAAALDAKIDALTTDALRDRLDTVRREIAKWSS